MANTNNLEFLGREGLTTLLSQVNTNSNDIKQIKNNGGSGGDGVGLIYVEEIETANTTCPTTEITAKKLVYGNGALVFYGQDAEGPIFFYSLDNGQNWLRGVTDFSYPCGKIVFGNGVFVGSSRQTNKIIYSVDGINWNERVICDDYDDMISQLLFCNGKFIYINEEIIFASENGVEWNSSSCYFEMLSGAYALDNYILIDDNYQLKLYTSDSYEYLNLIYTLPHDNNLTIETFANKIVIYGDFEGSRKVLIGTLNEANEVHWSETFPKDNDPDYSWGKVYYKDDNIFLGTGYSAGGHPVLKLLEDDGYWQVVGDSNGSIQQITSSKDLLFALASNYDTNEQLVVITEDGANWSSSLKITGKSYLEQEGKDITEKVANLVSGGNNSPAEPVEDTNTTYSVQINTSGAKTGTYLVDSDGSSIKISNLHDITTANSESSVTNGRNTSIGTGIKLSQIFGSGHTIGNNLSASLIRGQGHTIGADVNHIDVSGYKNSVNGDYNTIHGTEFNVAGTHNVTFGVGGKCTINGKANMMAGDLTGSNIVGNYNTILCGGGQNTITGTESDPCQHNVILGSTTTLTSAENCLTLGRLNTIDNHDRVALMGIGLIATRDNQLIVGKYNDDIRKGGIFIVGNGVNNDEQFLGTVSSGMEMYINDWSVTASYYAEENTSREIARIFNTGSGWTTDSNILTVHGTGDLQYIMPNDDSVWEVYKSNRSNAMTVYTEGTVTIGHDPIGPMDVATKQYVDSHSSSGGVDEEQVRDIVEDILLNGSW